jgi:hypothetical protein
MLKAGKSFFYFVWLCKTLQMKIEALMFLILRLHVLELINKLILCYNTCTCMHCLPEIEVGLKLHHGAFLRGHFLAESAGEMNSGPINPRLKYSKRAVRVVEFALRCECILQTTPINNSLRWW